MEHIAPAGVAALLAAAGTWVLAGLARRLGAVAKVSADRWHSSGDIPRLAGPALLGATAFWLSGPELALLAAVCGLGAADDIRPLSPQVKALGLLAMAAGAVVVTGLWWTGPALWLAANAVNLFDHADGLAAATMAAAFIGLGGDAGWAAAGACAGFLILNYPPARVFMGDGGSLTLGALAVLLAARTPEGPVAVGIWCLLPLADATRVTLSRLARGQKPWIGGTDHAGHALLRAGLPPRLLPLSVFAATLACGLALTAALQ